MDEQKPANKTLMIMGIILCLLLAGSAVYYFKNYPSDSSKNTETANENNGDSSVQAEKNTDNNVQENSAEQQPAEEDAITSVWQIIKPVDQTDHVLGSSNAELTIVTYSDINCPYCKLFHATMEQIMDTYGKDGAVSWVFRHFPIPGLHPTSEKEAEATECVAELGGNAKFWTFINKLVEEPALDSVNTSAEKESARIALLTRYAEDVGVDKDKFEQCLDSRRHADKISNSTNEAISLGAQGTPFGIVVDKNGKIAPIPGYMSFDQMKQNIDSILGLPVSQ